ncbi:PWI domain-containing protein [Limtongia smithiae]|uniref:PWI domain-containing protein n=1 Tax=Limtongia smithiae TaxID=1125753 RepID=UPI0034CD7900
MLSAGLSDADRRRVRATRFPREFDVHVDLAKVNLPVMRVWIAQRLDDTANGDDIATEYILSLFDDDTTYDIKALQIQLEGLLPNPADAAAFCMDLQTLMLDAQTTVSGVPKRLVAERREQWRRERERQ